MEVVRMIAYYQVDFTQVYEEMANLVNGRATFSEGILKGIYLEDEDFDSYQFDESTDTHNFEGETYESDYKILETILERKVSKINPESLTD